MSIRSYIRNLQIITALDSLSYGFLYRFMGSYVEKLGGGYLAVGILATGTNAAKLLSDHIMKSITSTYEKKQALTLLFILFMLINIITAITRYYWFAIILRVAFQMFHVSQRLCLTLLLEKERDLFTRKTLLRNFDVLNAFGYVAGPVISGYMFEAERGFRYVAALAATLNLVNIVILFVNIDGSKNAEENEINILEYRETQSFWQKSVEAISQNINALRKCQLEKNWDILLMRYLYSCSVFAFFSRFLLLIKHKYENITFITGGYIIAFSNIMTFLCNYYITHTPSSTERYPLIFTAEMLLFLLSVFMCLACFSPILELYLLLLIPIIFVKSTLVSMWNGIFLERRNEFLTALKDVAKLAAYITIPLLFGISCYNFSHYTVISFSCIPITMCWIITRFYSRKIVIDDNNNVGDSTSLDCCCIKNKKMN